MLYGHPELTSDRKVPKDLEERLLRRFPKIRVAWHNEFGSWVILQAPIAHDLPWDFVMICDNPATGIPKEIGPWVLRWLELNYEATEDLQANVLKAQATASAARAKRRAAWRKQEVSEPIARAMFPQQFGRRESFAGAGVGVNKPVAGFTARESGLIVPSGG